MSLTRREFLGFILEASGLAALEIMGCRSDNGSKSALEKKIDWAFLEQEINTLEITTIKKKWA